MRWFVRGDIDGFFGLALDNLVQLLLIDALCRYVLGFPDDAAVRARPAGRRRLAAGRQPLSTPGRPAASRARRGRADVCALPYGINTVSLFAHVFLVMLPAKLAAEARGRGRSGAHRVAGGARGVPRLGADRAGRRVRRRSACARATPRAALLSTLAGIALGFISLGFLFRTFAHPIVGLATLAIVLLTYFGRVRFRGGLPGGLVAVAARHDCSRGRPGIAPVGAGTGGAPRLHLPVPRARRSAQCDALDGASARPTCR